MDISKTGGGTAGFSDMYRILIVDDEKVFRDGLSRNLPWAENGLSVIGEAQNGKEAIDLIESAAPDIVLTDIMMPQMDGLELAEHIRSHHPDIKVIMLTVMDSFPEMRRSIRAQVSDYVLKFNYAEETIPAVLKACRQIESERIISKDNPRIRHDDISFLRDCLKGNVEDSGHDKFMDLRGAVILASPSDTELYLLIQCELKKLRIPDMKSYIVDSGSSECLIVFMKDMDEGSIMRAGRSIMHQVTADNPQYRYIRIGVGSFRDNPADLIESRGEAEIALSMTELSGTNLLFHFNLKGDSSYYQILIQKAMEYIDSNFSDKNLSLTDTARHFNLSPSYFSTIFRQVSGLGFNEYLTRVRLNTARNLLANTPLLIYEIAERAGYATPQYMSILFKRYYGFTLGEYRKMHSSGMKEKDND